MYKVFTDFWLVFSRRAVGKAFRDLYRVSSLGPLTYESGALPTALSGPAVLDEILDLIESVSERFTTYSYTSHCRSYKSEAISMRAKVKLVLIPYHVYISVFL